MRATAKTFPSADAKSGGGRVSADAPVLANASEPTPKRTAKMRVLYGFNIVLSPFFTSKAPRTLRIVTEETTCRMVNGSEPACPFVFQPCRQTFTAEMMRMAASRGSRTTPGTTPSRRPPMKVPTTEPSAMMKTNWRFCPRTAKLRSRL
jgi:hypothetical protein